MPRKNRNELKKHTLYFRAGDIERIQEVFASKAISASEVIRTLVSKYVDRLNTVDQNTIDQLKDQI